jgi:hypothetical protein
MRLRFTVTFFHGSMVKNWRLLQKVSLSRAVEMRAAVVPIPFMAAGVHDKYLPLGLLISTCSSSRIGKMIKRNKVAT